jgi:hypothetical protein
MKTNVYSEEWVLTAMCIWEAALDNEVLYNWLRQPEGAWQARNNALQLIEPIERMYASVSERYGDAFDWEFVPKACALIIEQVASVDDLNQVDEKAIVTAIVIRED